MTKIKVIIQCRTNSSRLPGKAFLPINGIATAVLCAKRAMNRQAEVVVATSDATSDDNLVKLLTENQIPVYRGPLQDVLKRYVLAAKEMDETDYIIRLTADNMFPDGSFINEIIDYVITSKLDYCRSDYISNDLPYGLGCEVFTVAMLRQADANASSLADREHVTPWIQRKADNIYHYKEKFALSATRCTLDTLDDYLNLQHIFNDCEDIINIPWQLLCDKLATLQEKPKSIATHYKNALPISTFTLGTVQLGMKYGITNPDEMMSEEEASQLLLKAREYGIRSFDCARGYGQAESRVGNFLNSQQNICIVTKLSPFFSTEDESKNIDSVRASIYQSCYELKVRSLDVLMLHRFWQYKNPRIWNELLSLKSKGIIKHLGMSINTVDEGVQALHESEIEYIQLPYNLLDWRWHDEQFQLLLANRKDVTLFARSILLQGLLVATPSCWPERFNALGVEITKTISTLVESLGRKNALDLCIAYARSQPWINSLVIGCTNSAQLKENIDLFNQPALSKEDSLLIREMLPVCPESLLNPSQW